MNKKKNEHFHPDIVPIIMGLILIGITFWVGYQIVAAPFIQAQEIKTDLNKMYLRQIGEKGYNVSEVTWGYIAKLQNGTILYVNERGCSGCGEGYYLDTEQHVVGCSCPNVTGIIPTVIIAGIVIAVGFSLAPKKLKEMDNERTP